MHAEPVAEPVSARPEEEGAAQPRGELCLRDVCNLAGLVTLFRLPLTLSFPFVAPYPRQALLVYVLAIVSDILDGVIARRTNTTSHTGAFIDGWMDKIFHVNGAWSLVLFDYMPAWWMLCWFSRELVQIPMFYWMTGPYWRGEIRPHHAHLMGKITTWSIAVAFIACLLGWQWLAAPLTPIAGLFGLATGAIYLKRDWPYLQRARAQSRSASR